MGIFDDDDDKLIAENEQWKLFKNTMTKIYQKNLDEYERDGFSVKGDYIVVLAESKIDGRKTYLAIDSKTGRPIADWTDGSEFDFKKALLVNDVRDGCNIVNMAEEMQKKKRRRKNESR